MYNSKLAGYASNNYKGGVSMSKKKQPTDKSTQDCKNTKNSETKQQTNG